MKTVIKLLLSALFLAVLVWMTGLETLVEAVKSASLVWLLPCVAVYLLGQWISSLRWQYLAKVQNFHRPLMDYVDLYFLGMVASLFLPGAMGGDAVRTVLLARWSNRKKREAVLTLLAERGVGLLTLVWVASVVCLLPQSDVIPLTIKQSVWGLAIASVLGWALVAVLPLQRMATKFSPLTLLVSARPYWASLRIMGVSLGLSFLVQGGMVLVHWWMAQATGINVHPLIIVAVYCLVTLVSALPIAFAGFGVREGAYQALLGYAGVSSAMGLAYGLYWVLILLVTTAIAGAWVVWRRPDLLDWVRHSSPSLPEDKAVISPSPLASAHDSPEYPA